MSFGSLRVWNVPEVFYASPPTCVNRLPNKGTAKTSGHPVTKSEPGQYEPTYRSTEQRARCRASLSLRSCRPSGDPQLLPLRSSVWKAKVATYLSRASHPGRLYWTTPPSSALSRLFPPRQPCPQPQHPLRHLASQEQLLQGPLLVLTLPTEIKAGCKLLRKETRRVCQT